MLLIDVYNVLHVTGILPPDIAGLEVGDLAKLIRGSRYAREEVILVCDGTGGGAANFGIDRKRNAGGSGVKRNRRGREGRKGTAAVVYAGPGMEADSIMEMMLRGGGRFGNASAGRYGKSTVVSSDRRVRFAAKKANARSLASEEFLQQLVDDHRRPVAGHMRSSPGADDRPAFARNTPLDQYTVEEWMREFGFSPQIGKQDDWESLTEELADRQHRSDASSPTHGTETDSGTTTPAATPSSENSPPPNSPDPLIRAAMKQWPGRVKSDDLDMEKWLEGDPRLD
jgi:hypothetical protein